MVGFIANQSTVNLSEQGTSASESKENTFKDSDTPAQDEVIELAEKKLEENKNLTWSEAQAEVLKENSKLSDAYDKEVSL
jgi:hypothetical protein